MTPVDTTDALLERFAAPEWREVEEDWVQGKISSCECMARQIPMIRAGKRELDAFIDTIPLAPGFKEFVAFCLDRGVALSIVSDGVDYVIRRILAQHGLSGLRVMANHLVIADEGYALTFPSAQKDCAFGMCKCAVSDVRNVPTVLIGDGRSDTCIARHAAAVYARRGFPLEAYCVANKIGHTPFIDFYSILEGIQQLIHKLAGDGHGASSV